MATQRQPAARRGHIAAVMRRIIMYEYQRQKSTFYPFSSSTTRSLIFGFFSTSANLPYRPSPQTKDGRKNRPKASSRGLNSTSPFTTPPTRASLFAPVAGSPPVPGLRPSPSFTSYQRTIGWLVCLNVRVSSLRGGASESFKDVK